MRSAHGKAIEEGFHNLKLIVLVTLPITVVTMLLYGMDVNTRDGLAQNLISTNPQLRVCRHFYCCLRLCSRRERGRRHILIYVRYPVVSLRAHKLILRSFRHIHGVRVNPPPRAASITTSELRRARRSETTLLVLLPFGSLFRMRIETPIFDSR